MTSSSPKNRGTKQQAHEPCRILLATGNQQICSHIIPPTRNDYTHQSITKPSFVQAILVRPDIHTYITYIHTYIHIFIHRCMHACMHLCINICMYVLCVYIYMYVYIICVYIYIHRKYRKPDTSNLWLTCTDHLFLKPCLGQHRFWMWRILPVRQHTPAGCGKATQLKTVEIRGPLTLKDG